MIQPIKLKLTLYQAEALRKYAFQMLQVSLDCHVRTEVITVAEWAPRLDALVRSRMLRGIPLATYAMPVSIARILWCRWQRETINEHLQLVLANIDQQLLNVDRRPEFIKNLI